MSSTNSVQSQSKRGDDHHSEPVMGEEDNTVKILKFFDVIAPCPKESIKGHLKKGILRNVGKRRRISIEEHTVPNSTIGSFDTDNESGGGSYAKKTFIRLSKRASRSYAKSSSPRNQNPVSNSSIAVDDLDLDVDDVSSVASESVMGNLGEESVIEFPVAVASPLPAIVETQPDDGPMVGSSIINREKWNTTHKFDASFVTIEKINNNRMTICTTFNERKQTRDLTFTSSDEASDFVRLFDECKINVDRRKAMGFQRQLKSLKIQDNTLNENHNFLIEIVGAEKLVVADLKSSDPYVVVKFGGKTVHRTKHVSKNLNPIWTLRTDSLFIFSITPKELFSNSQGMTLHVYDYDLTGKDEFLGAAEVPSYTLFNAKEERETFDLKPVTFGHRTFPSMKAGQTFIGKIAIRCREATDYDIEFLNNYNKEKNQNRFQKMAKRKKDSALKKTDNPNALKSAIRKNVQHSKDEHGSKVVKYRIRPDPNPNAPSVKWMTKNELEEEVMAPSNTFRNLGFDSASCVAKIFLEILKCDDLPNLDFGPRNKTDAFVQIVYEDCIAETCVIHDSLSPRWMPWTDRAFALHTKYPSSMIYVGVHDYDPGPSNAHDFVGRCAIDVTNLSPNTVYLLDYALYDTASKQARKAYGKITVRLRVEIDDPRAHVLASLKVPPPVYVNTKTSKNFNCVRHTITGIFDEKEYSVTTTTDLVYELYEQLRVVHYIEEILYSHLFWRSNTNTKIRVPALFSKYTAEKEIWLPLASLIVFLVAISVVEHPRLIPSISCYFIGYLLLTTRMYRNDYPNPWWRCMSIRNLFLSLAFGDKKFLSPEKIDVDQNKEEAEATDAYWKDLIEHRENNAQKIANEQIEQDLEMIEAKGDADDISTKTTKLSLDPLVMLKPYIYPAQLTLLYLCRLTRTVKNVILWEESNYSFLITLAMFALGTVFLCLPWYFICRWSARIVVWGLFGPWMRFMDPGSTGGDDEQDTLKRAELRNIELGKARIQNEDAKKYQDFKKYHFGEFSTRVPIIKTDRMLDLPLPSSSATPLLLSRNIATARRTFGEIAIEEATGEDHEAGQQLLGLMIPMIKAVPTSIAPTGQPAKQKPLLKVVELGGDVSDDSTYIAYTKIGTMAAVAAGLSYFSVPFLMRVLSLAYNNN